MNTVVAAHASMRIAGADGCARGWVVASIEGHTIVRHLVEIVDEFDVIGVDMPIGLAPSGSRACDLAARRFLSPRGSTVFPAPNRAVIHHHDYAAANAASKAAFGKGLSRQAFALFPKIREVDDLVRHHRSAIVEVHPECSFARMAGHVLPRKRSADGEARRLALVEASFGAVDLEARLRPGAARDDVLDAYAALWSAQRFARGEHAELGDGEVDAVGLPMRIVI